jgi:hypothetical protein
MGNRSNLPTDRDANQRPIDPEAAGISLSREGNPLGQTRADLQSGKFNSRPGNLDFSKAQDIFLARAESLRPEYFSALADTRQERRKMLDDQLAKLERVHNNPNLTDMLIEAFERDYDKIAPVLDRFENSKHFSNAQSSDKPDRLRELLKRQELMEWVNRASRNGEDNPLKRLTRDQQSELDTLEKVAKPGAAEPKEVKDAVAKAAQQEKIINDFKRGAGGAQSLGSVGGYRRGDRGTMPAAAQAYIHRTDAQARDIVDGVLTNGELHYVPDTLKRLADLDQQDHDLRARQKKPLNDQEHAKVVAEQKALRQVNKPASMDEALEQAQWRALLIRREINGITPNETYLLRCFEDRKGLPAAIENPFNNPAKIPGGVATAIKDGFHHIDQNLIPARYKSLSDQCVSDKLRGKVAHLDYEYWARLAERDALAEFREATPEHEKARALVIRQQLVGLNRAETTDLTKLRYLQK